MHVAEQKKTLTQRERGRNGITLFTILDLHLHFRAKQEKKRRIITNGWAGLF